MSKRGKDFDVSGLLDGRSPAKTLKSLADVGYGGSEWIQQQYAGQINFDADGAMWVGQIRMTTIGLSPDTEMSEVEYRVIAEIMGKLSDSINFLLGDLLVYGESKWGETAAQIAADVGLDIGTIYNYAYVCRNVQFSLRRENSNLKWKHYVLVAPLTQKEQRYWLDMAEQQGWSANQMGREMKQERQAEQGKTVLDQAPKLNNSIRKLFEQAKDGDDQAAGKVRSFLADLRDWISAVEEQL